MVPEFQFDPALMTVFGIIFTCIFGALILAAVAMGIIGIRRRNYRQYLAAFWATIVLSLVGAALGFVVMSQPASLVVGFVGVLLALSLGLASTFVRPTASSENEED